MLGMCNTSRLMSSGEEEDGAAAVQEMKNHRDSRSAKHARARVRGFRSVFAPRPSLYLRQTPTPFVAQGKWCIREWVVRLGGDKRRESMCGALPSDSRLWTTPGPRF